MKTTGKLR